ncbi:MAG: ABC-2 transporter permease [Ruminococcus sp.]|nr:ABC-2 transporter permease [Ruminococcus sp.]
MKGLLYKELIINRKNLISILLGELAVSAIILLPSLLPVEGVDTDTIAEFTALMSILVFIVMFLIAGMLAAGFFEADENKRWAFFIASTPASAAAQVRVKYICTFTVYTLLLGYCFLLSKITEARGTPVSFFAALAMFFLMILLHAAEFPFTVRFGSKAGGMVKTAFGMLVMLIGIEYFLFGDISAFEETDIIALTEQLGKAGVISGVTSMTVTAFPFFSLSMYLFSCVISERLYTGD